MNHLLLKSRLTAMNFLEFAVWGAYLTSLGTYLAGIGMVPYIKYFYMVQGIVSIFMPGLIGVVADRWMPAQRLLGLCHLLAGLFMGAASIYAMQVGTPTDPDAMFSTLFALYTLSVAFYMPTLALSNSVAFNALQQANLDTIKAFPPIRVFGTVGFIVTMLIVNFTGYQTRPEQLLVSAALSLVLALYAPTLPSCPIAPKGEKKSLAEALGLKALSLLRTRRMATFFIFSMLLGVSLQITNGFANPFITHFKEIPEFANTWGAQNANALISISQISETLCILLIPFAMKFFGIKKVMLIAMFAWVFRFGLFGAGNPGPGVWMFVLSCIVYGVAFDFFNISGSLYVNMKTDEKIRSSAQGLFMLMTNGIGATIGTLSAQAVVNHFVYNSADPSWSSAWYVFAAYALVVGVLFTILFKDPQKQAKA